MWVLTAGAGTGAALAWRVVHGRLWSRYLSRPRQGYLALIRAERLASYLHDARYRQQSVRHAGLHGRASCALVIVKAATAPATKRVIKGRFIGVP